MNYLEKCFFKPWVVGLLMTALLTAPVADAYYHEQLNQKHQIAIEQTETRR